MVVTLNVLDRLLILNVLPAEDNITTLRLVRKLKENIGFTDEELKVLDFKQVDAPGGKKNTVWNSDIVDARDFNISEKAYEIIKNALKKLNDANKLTEQHLPLWDKFVEPLKLEGEE